MRNFPWTTTCKFFLYATPFALVIVTKSALFPFIVGKYAWFRASIGLALIFFLFGLLFDWEEGRKHAKKMWCVIKSPLGMAVTAFTIIYVVAGMLGTRPSYSFWSNFERGEGGVQMLALFALFLLLGTLFEKESDWRKLFWTILWAGLLMVLYGVGAGLEYNGFIGMEFDNASFRFQGSLGNPSYVAIFLLFASFYAAYILTTRYRKHLFKAPGAILIWILLGAYAVTFLLAATRGAFLGLIGGAGVGLVYFALVKKSWRKWAIAALALIMLAAGGFIAFRNTEFVRNIPGSRIFDISLSTETFRHRRIMWGIAWDAFKERPLLGYGPESFGPVFQEKFDPAYFEPDKGMGAWFDRAHNIWFDYLVQTGILGTLAYVAIFAIIYWNMLRRRIEKRTGLPSGIAASALAVPTAYLIQGLVLFDILPTYLNLFMFFAFMWFLFYDKHENTA